MRGLLLALAGSLASGALLDEEASTAPVTFGGASARRAAQPLLHSEEVPDWVRLTFADHYLGATRRSAPVDAFEEAVDGEMEEEKRGLELLEESEHSRADLFDSHMPADHAHAVSELNVHRHVSRTPHRRGRRRTHALDGGEHVRIEPIHEPIRADASRARLAASAREGWGGGGVDAMLDALADRRAREDAANGGDAHGEHAASTWPYGLSHDSPVPVTEAPAAPRRPAPSLQGRAPSREGPGARAPSALQRGPSSSANSFGAGADLSRIAEEAANRALRAHGLLDDAPPPVATSGASAQGAPAGASSFLDTWAGGAWGGAVGVDARTGGATRLPPQTAWQTDLVDSVLDGLGIAPTGRIGAGTPRAWLAGAPAFESAPHAPRP